MTRTELELVETVEECLQEELIDVFDAARRFSVVAGDRRSGHHLS